MSAVDTIKAAQQVERLHSVNVLYDLGEFGNPKGVLRPQVQVVDDEASILTARRLHAYRYLLEGYVKKEDITPNGTLNEIVDPYASRSTYFTLSDEATPTRPVMVARQIRFDPEHPFPVLKNMTITPEATKLIESLDVSKCVEISGLAKLPTTDWWLSLVMYGKMLQHSLEEKHDTWFIASDEKLTQSLQTLFDGTIVRMGETQHYMGSLTDPLLLDPKHVFDTLLHECVTTNDPLEAMRKKEIVKGLIEGLDMEVLDEEQRALIHQIFA